MGVIEQFPNELSDILLVAKISPQDSIEPSFILQAHYAALSIENFSVSDELFDLRNVREFVDLYLEQRSVFVCEPYRGFDIQIYSSRDNAHFPFRVCDLSDLEREAAFAINSVALEEAQYFHGLTR